MSEIERIFLELIRIDSPSGEEGLVSEFLEKWLTKLGFFVKKDIVGNIYASSGDSPRFFLCAHMDTVEPGRGIKPVVVDGVVRSDGKTILGADNKAAISSIIVAVDEYVRENNKLPEVEIVFSVREETGGGIEFFNFEWLKSKKGAIFDFAKPLGKIALAAPYIYNFYAKFTGKPAHSSRPEEGVNSQTAAIKFLSSVKVGRFDDGETTINIGKISSGSGINTIPEETLIEGEVRSTNHEKFLLRLAEIKKLAYQCLEGSLAKLEYKVDGYCPGYKLDKESKLITSIVKILEEQELDVEYVSSTGVSDANSFNGAGLEVVNLSDGVCDPHTKKESVSLASLQKMKEIVYRMLEVW